MNWCVFMGLWVGSKYALVFIDEEVSSLSTLLIVILFSLFRCIVT